MTELELAKALIAAAEQTYIEKYYGENLIPLFTRDKVAFSTDTSGEHCITDEGE